MKKFLTALLITTCAVFSALGIAACVPGDLEAHSWSDEWLSTSTKHWRKCEDPGCNGRTDYADHDWEVSETYEAPTCGETGLGQYTCKVCGATMGNANNPATIPVTGEHTWELQSVDAAPTCGEDGSGSYICSVCYEYSVFPIPATGEHDYSGNYRGTSEGHYHVCLNGCGINEEIEPHEIGDPIISEPSGNMDGRIDYICQICRYVVKSEEIINPDVLYRIEVEFIRGGISVVPEMGEDDELHVLLVSDATPRKGYKVKITGYTVENKIAAVSDVTLYHYNEYTAAKKALGLQSGGDSTTQYLGYTGFSFDGEQLDGYFYVAQPVSNASLWIESLVPGRGPVSLKVIITATSTATTSMSVDLPVINFAPVYYLEKKNND